MNKVRSLAILATALLLMGGMHTSLQAQSKKEQKALTKQWKKKAAQYKKNPMALKAKEESCSKAIDDLTKKNAELTERLAQMQADMNALEAVIRKQRGSFDSLKYEYGKLKTQFEAKKVEVVTEAMPGIVYRVQIGAYEKFNIDSKLTGTDENFKGESQDNLNKFLMGKFKDYNLAKAFAEDIKKLGIRDAFVVAYKDGVRMRNIQEALKAQGVATDAKSDSKAGAKPNAKPKPGDRPADPFSNEDK
jgi:seryl-tRNA synthetase